VPERRDRDTNVSPIFTTVKSRIRLIMPRGPEASKRLSELVRAQGGRVLGIQEWLRTRDLSVAEILVQTKKGAASFRLLTSLEESAGMMVLDMHSVGNESVSQER